MLDLVDDGSSWDEIKILAQAIEDAGATIINTGIGWHEAEFQPLRRPSLVAPSRGLLRKMKDEKIVSVPLCATNRINATARRQTISSDGAMPISFAWPDRSLPILKLSGSPARVMWMISIRASPVIRPASIMPSSAGRPVV